MSNLTYIFCATPIDSGSSRLSGVESRSRMLKRKRGGLIASFFGWLLSSMPVSELMAGASEVPWVLCGEGRVDYLAMTNNLDTDPAYLPILSIKLERMSDVTSLEQYHRAPSIVMMEDYDGIPFFSQHYATLSAALATGRPVKIYGSAHGYPATCHSIPSSFTIVTCENNDGCFR